MKTTIVGAGLCGLAIAFRLQQAGIEVSILEANHCAGGRIQPAGDSSGHQDLGPTWVWPYAQPIVTQWLDELELELFEQFATGNGLLDRSTNTYATHQMLPSQHGSARIVGGTYALIRRLEKYLAGFIHYDSVVKSCSQTTVGWQLSVSTSASTSSASIKTITTDRLIIATPPRLAAAMLVSEKATLADVLPELLAAETWMAPHAKVVVFYDTAFWRAAGLSGRIASHVGPLAEVHDHSGPNGLPAALFGFCGVPADVRKQLGDQFVDAISQQLQRCFGEQAPAPTKIVIKDWAYEPFTTTEADRHGSGAHPPTLDKLIRQAHCGDSLWLAGSETAAISAGLIEGAFARADEVAKQIAELI